MRSRPCGTGSGLGDGGARAAHLVAVRLGQAQSAGGRGEPLDVPGEREGPSLGGLDGLEDPVADGQSVVQHGDRARRPRPGARRRARSSLGLSFRSSPCRGRRGPYPDATSSSRDALSSVSAHSASGSEPQVIPAPVPKRSSGAPSGASRSIQKVRMPTASSPVPRSASTQPIPPQYGPRGACSSSSDDPQGAQLGGAGDRAGRKGAPRAAPASRCRGRAHRGRWRRGGRARGARSTPHSAGTVTDPGAQTRPRSLRTRSTIITFSAWSFSSRSAAVRPVPLMGPEVTVRPERRRYSSGEAVATSTPWAGRRTVPAYGAGLPRARRAASSSMSEASGIGQRCAQDAAEVGLVDVAGGYVLAYPRDTGDVGGAVQGAAPRVPARARATASRGGCRPAADGPTSRTSPKRAHSSRPSKSATTAHQPADSRAAGSSVTSLRSVASTSPKRASGDGAFTKPSLWCGVGATTVRPQGARSRTVPRTSGHAGQTEFELAPISARVHHVAGTR